MIYDFRMYTLKPGATPDYRAGVKEVGLPIRQNHDVALSGWYWSDVGALNQVVHIWGYQDLEHLQSQKAAVYADPDWSGKYVPRAQPLVESQKTWLMMSPAFAPTYPVRGPIAEEGTPEYKRKNDMVFDFRQYTLNPGGLPTYMSAVEDLAIPIRQRHGVKLAGWFYSDLGDLNQVVHIWAFDNVKHMEEAKAAVAADPEWGGAYIPRVRGVLSSQNTYLMKTTEFGPTP